MLLAQAKSSTANFSFTFLILFWSLGRQRLSLRWFKSNTKTTTQKKKTLGFISACRCCFALFTLLGTVRSSLSCCARGGLGCPYFGPFPSSSFLFFLSLLHTRYERREEWWWHSWFLPVILHLLLIFHPASP